MKAAQMNNYGDSSVIVINEVERLALKPGQVLVEVDAASLNPFDSKIRSGLLKDRIPLQFPTTLGGDFAGVVAEINEGINNLQVGDKVYGQGIVVAGDSGAFAEFVAVEATHTAKAPANLSFTEAAALPLVGVSALQALTEHLDLQSGQKIFIHGGAGGIGNVAIQLAKHIGAYVATTATGDTLEHGAVPSADEVIDYKKQDFSEVLKDYDAAFDTVGGEDTAKALKILKQGGKLVSMTTPVDETEASERGISAIIQSTGVATERLDTLRQLIEDGVVEPLIGKVFPLEQARQAFEARESGTVAGKIILKIKSD